MARLDFTIIYAPILIHLHCTGGDI